MRGSPDRLRHILLSPLFTPYSLFSRWFTFSHFSPPLPSRHKNPYTYPHFPPPFSTMSTLINGIPRPLTEQERKGAFSLAVRLLMNLGWTQHTSVGRHGSLCLVRAIHDATLRILQPSRDELDQAYLHPHHRELCELVLKDPLVASRATSKDGRSFSPETTLTLFNDHTDTTFSDVMGALYRTQERQSAPIPT